ncbi:hypothetical protein E7T09_12420 [Deinococcus sp. KSM4-11]|uniref:hypothetical protein n=1 Tax=Deinococcus sp. KSM4-11 TaxID=2568654 RepID=UPI0010A3BBA7|nr:hypothetical protein [Deinococcus sp. KSM4-11]THF86044.1 hypothetical protein E7T09_12420 [Deinococcus sp. KSM4-11]
MKVPRPPRPLRLWLRRWAVEALRAVDSWEENDPVPDRPGVPEAWLERVRGASGIRWMQAGESAAVSGPAGPERGFTVSAVQPAVPHSSDREVAPPRRLGTPIPLTFSVPLPVTDSRPVFPEHPASPPAVQTEVREVRPMVPPPFPPTWDQPLPTRPPAPPHWPAVAPPSAPPPWPLAAPKLMDSPVPAWPTSSTPVQDEGITAWPQTPVNAVGMPTYSQRVSGAPEVAWSAAAEEPPLEHWPTLPAVQADPLDVWHAARREQERWRELEREQAGERWNGSIS